MGSGEETSPGEDAVLSSLEIMQFPNQLVYLLYSPAINLDGLIVEGVYSDGGRKVLPVSEMQVSGFSTETEAEQCPVTLSFEGKQVSFMISVINSVVEDGVLTQIVEKSGALYRVPEGVKSVGSNVFSECSFDQVILPEGVEELQSGAFYGSGVGEVMFPSSLKQIGEKVFARCRNLKTADLSQTRLEIIPEYAFWRTSLETVRFPETLKFIEDQSFLGTVVLKDVTFPASLETIGHEAFRESGVERVILPHAVRLIKSRAFYLCEHLSEVDCQGMAEEGRDGVMEGNVFLGCPVLSRIVFPESLSSIGATQFSGGVCLQSLTLGRNLAQLGHNALGNCVVEEFMVYAEVPPALDFPVPGVSYSLPKAITTVLRVPAASLETYKQSEGWKKWKDKMQGDI